MNIKVYLRGQPNPIEYEDVGYFIGMTAKTEDASGGTVKPVIQYQNNGLLTITKVDKDATGQPTQKNIAVFAPGWIYFECV